MIIGFWVKTTLNVRECVNWYILASGTGKRENIGRPGKGERIIPPVLQLLLQAKKGSVEKLEDKLADP